MNDRFFFLFYLLLGPILLPAQVTNNLTLHFVDDLTKINQQAKWQISKLRYYVSDIRLLDQNATTVYADDAYYLIDHFDPASAIIELANKEELDFSFIQFHFGVDSITNANGAQGAALDPIHGMYWTWQSGYINFKLEGVAPLCPARKNKFAFHLGGFQDGFRCDQSVTLKVNDKENLRLYFDLEQLYQGLDLQRQYHLMSPGESAMALAKLVAASFKIMP